jgi:uncharacterized membrane protein YgcG
MAALNVKLGRLPKRVDPRTLQLRSYLTPALAAPPVTTDWTTKVQSWPMFENDTVSDCTCATAGYEIEAWTVTATGVEAQVTADQVIAAYAAITGYSPTNGANDNGANVLDVLNYWRASGIAEHYIGAFAEVDAANHQEVQQSVYLFGGVYLGLNMPKTAQAQTSAKKAWDVGRGPGAKPGSWGGHAAPVLAYDPSSLTVVTWGALQKMTWSFLDTYCDEAYALISQDWLGSADKSPAGLNLQQLKDDLAVITSSAPGSSTGGSSSSSPGAGSSSSSSAGGASSSSSGGASAASPRSRRRKS